ncbi:glycoside hydrolase superfamily [Aspergillus ambiguus]|uniref:glycoside hydrolase family 18 protein n=1 Tax=Aspergillus ambiguus TaxID=176160 RepID=UPI003CCE377D
MLPGVLAGPSPGYVSAAYFVNWAIYGRNYHPHDLPAENLTHILYAFANVDPGTGNVSLTDSWSDLERHYPGDEWDALSTDNAYGCIKQLFVQKQRNRALKILLSIGGWTYSKNFPDPVATDAGRRRFAESAVKLMQDAGFDGLDIDWEYPEDEKAADNLTQLLKELREELDDYSKNHGNGKHFLLTLASPAGPTHYSVLKPAEMDRFLDYWNLMSYDYSGSWDQTAGHSSNLYASPTNGESTPFNTDQAINYYVSHGVPSRKIILGMPLYGRAFADTDGPGSPFHGVGEGSWEPGVWDYKALPRGGSHVTEQCDIVAAFSYDSERRTMISYDTPSITKMKGRYIKAKQLGGAMWWESSGDSAGELSLIAHMVDELGGTAALDQGQNQLNYPMSRFRNIRVGLT